MFDIMIWAGVAMSLAGLAGLIWCILRVGHARRAKISDDAMRAVLKSVLPINLGALGLSILGLMLVGLGAFLG
ncbi:hypothetical protein [Antarcticimicrobium luteum]|uniref:Uncharacterized protein n=1 Tax=Antarcticimicrobium luteum TaxID=2547397 RepID=A0A4R5UQB0_9RHOB|nr:hypothetical protein [Antarcticimicrobium luteum]TDK41218.1 hypothetical protein E1832_21245 [Antarcticimicrobium luteum]